MDKVGQKFIHRIKIKRPLMMLPVRKKQRNPCWRSSIILIIPKSMRKSAPNVQRACFWWVLQEPERPSWQKLLPEKQTCLSFQYLALNLSRCLLAEGQPKCANSSSRQANRHRASFLSMKLTRSAKEGIPNLAAMMSVNRRSTNF